MNRTRIALAASMMTLLGSAPMMAQTCSTNPCIVGVATTATVNDVLRLTLDQVTLDLGTPTEADYDATFKDAASHRTATVKAKAHSSGASARRQPRFSVTKTAPMAAHIIRLAR